jgi:pimeloyl-ACP methyl ester carboxylesterase
MSSEPAFSRRSIIGGAAAGFTLAGAAREAQTQAQAPGRTFVLVHGACHGGWCWRRVADRLQGKGHKVFAPTMTGLGERSHLLSKDVRLATHVADIANLIRWEGLSEIVLVGHSYGGFIISAVAEELQSSIASIVYLDALLPENGTSVADMAGAPARIEIAAAKAKGEIALKPPPAEVFRVNPKDRAWVDAMMTPQPIATLTDKLPLTGACERVGKKTYIRAGMYQYMLFDKALAQCKADKSWRTFQHPTSGHDIMIDAPAWLAGILLEVA